ncbi:MAG: hypothetical protein ABSG11_21425 [Candidatus Korobacteraceae bacterium]
MSTVTGQKKAAAMAAKEIEKWDSGSTTFHVVVSKGKGGFEVESFSSGPEADSLLEEVVVADVNGLHC